MNSVNEQSVVDCDEVELVDVEEVQFTNEIEKSFEFVPLKVLQSQNEKDRLINSWKIKPPKNLILVEGNPLDDMGMQKTRRMRNFPTEELLSAKIRTANGTDYSNHYIEQHYNSGSSSKLNKCKKRSGRIGIIDLIKNKKISLIDLGLGSENKNMNSTKSEEGIQETIDLTDNTNEVEIIGSKNPGDDSADKFAKKSDSPAVLRSLVPYSSSEDESDEESCLIIPLDKNNEIL